MIAIPESEVEITFVRAQGAGGQNVNKVSSAVHLRFDVRASASLSTAQKERLLAARDQRLSDDGVVVLKAQRHRSQELNKRDALLRLQAFVARATAVPKARKATRPTRASQEKRLDGKATRSRVKTGRAKVLDGL